MAKKRSRVSTGLSIQDIMRMDMNKFEKYSFTEQKEIVSRLASAANKRYRNFEKKGIVNPATLYMNLEGGKISVKNKDVDSIKEEYFRAKKFLSSKFSTQKGYREYTKQLERALKKENGGIYKGMDYSLAYATAFAYYDIIQDLSPNIQNIRDKYTITEKIAEFMQDSNNEQDIFSKIYEYLQGEYDREIGQFNSMSVSFGERLDNETPDRYKRKGF